MNFGKRLEGLIERENISKKELALALGIAPNTLSGYIKNKRQPDLTMLTKIADYFNTTTDYLLEYSFSGADNNSNLNATRDKLNSITTTMDYNHLEVLVSIASELNKYDLYKR